MSTQSFVCPRSLSLSGLALASPTLALKSSLSLGCRNPLSLSGAGPQMLHVTCPALFLLSSTPRGCLTARAGGRAAASEGRTNSPSSAPALALRPHHHHPSILKTRVSCCNGEHCCAICRSLTPTNSILPARSDQGYYLVRSQAVSVAPLLSHTLHTSWPQAISTDCLALPRLLCHLQHEVAHDLPPMWQQVSSQAEGHLR